MKNIKFSLKSIISGLLMLTIVFALVACDNNNDSTTDQLPIELNTNLTDKLVLDLSYEGKTYLNDRIGEATLISCSDGDTALFNASGATVNVRFLNVDTPETNGALEPWGKASSAFTCDKLENATTIVLEGRTVMTDTYGRNLAYIWYDGRLLNLELVELAYSKSDNGSDERYGLLFQQAETNARATGKRVYGEVDPNYHYGRLPVTMEYLVNNFAELMGKNIEFSGVVTKVMDGSVSTAGLPYGGNAYVRVGEHEVYLYTNHATTTKLTIGNLVTIEGTVSQHNGAYQIIGVTRNTVTVDDTHRFDLFDANLVTLSNIKSVLVGTLLEINNLEITAVENDNDSINIFVKDTTGRTAVLRIDKSITDRFTDIDFNVGDIIDVTAPLSQINGEYRLMLTNIGDVVFK